MYKKELKSDTPKRIFGGGHHEFNMPDLIGLRKLSESPRIRQQQVSKASEVPGYKVPPNTIMGESLVKKKL